MSIRNLVITLGIRLGILDPSQAKTLSDRVDIGYDQHDPTGFKEDIYLLHKPMIDEFLAEQRKNNE